MSRSKADDNKHFTTAVYGNGPGYQIVNGTRPDMNETVSCKSRLTLEREYIAPSSGLTE